MKIFVSSAFPEPLKIDLDMTQMRNSRVIDLNRRPKNMTFLILFILINYKSSFMIKHNVRGILNDGSLNSRSAKLENYLLGYGIEFSNSQSPMGNRPLRHSEREKCINVLHRDICAKWNWEFFGRLLHIFLCLTKFTDSIITFP